jgi:hypothetical protein
MINVQNASDVLVEPVAAGSDNSSFHISHFSFHIPHATDIHLPVPEHSSPVNERTDLLL